MALKGGEFIIREVQANEVFTPEDFTSDQLMMAEAATEFMDKEVVPGRERFEKKDYAFTEELMHKMGEMGFLGIAVPDQYGGLGMDFNTAMLICDRVSGVSGSLSTAYGAHTGIGTLPILLYGSEEQKKKYLPRIATGELMASYCLTEPDAGSDANSGKTTARLSEDSKSYILNGQKMWISNAGFADLFIVFARIEDDKYISAFLVDKGTPGLTMNEEEDKLGIRASSTRQVFLNDVQVPLENMLSDRGNGFKIAMNSLNVGRIKLAAAVLDSARRVITLSTQYANDRVQFKTPISSFGAIQSKIADMTARAWACESGVYRAGQDIEDAIQRLHSEGLSAQESKLKGVEEYAVECAILKVHGSEMMDFVADEGLQIYGGMGFSADAPMEAAYRDARIARIYEGTNEINRMLSIGQLLKKAMKGQLDLMSPAMAVGEELFSIPSFDEPDPAILFDAEKQALAKLKKAFLMVAGKAVETLGMDLEKEQEIVMNAADMLMEVYVAESAILRAEKIAEKKGRESAAHPIRMAQLYLQRAIGVVAHAGREAIHGFASGDELQVLNMGLKRFTKPMPINTIALRREIAATVIAANKYVG
jgi:alkylation response protein AidB-like acyl-CoA dehydrogenase